MTTVGDLELALTTDGSGLVWNICIWDINTGTIVSTYKGGVSAPHGIDLVASEYLLSAQNDKPLIHVWSVQSKDRMQMKMVTPGRVTALTVTPDGLYCLAGVGEKLHIWQIADGCLLEVLSRHFQPITCVKCTDDGSYFVTSGEDNLVLVWSMARILADEVSIIGGSRSTVEPLHTWTQHSLSVNDIHIGHGGSRARVVTCSADQTCKLFDMMSGQLLLSVIFDVGLTSVTMDAEEARLFVGASSGKIYQVNLTQPPRGLEHHFGEENDADCFDGHRNKITSLSVSLDGSRLFSGSTDTTARVWDIRSRQCIKTLNHKGPVTNAFYIPVHENLFENEHFKPTVPFAMFKRNVLSSSEDTGRIAMYLTASDEIQKDDLKRDCVFPVHESGSISVEGGKSGMNWQNEASKLKAINKELYEFAIRKLIEN